MATQEGQHAARIRENLAAVRDRVAAAAARAGRRDLPRIVGITKYVEPAVARLLAQAGLNELGESRPQELWRKAAALADMQVRWHVVGHLQRNKVRRTLPLVASIDSADSLRLLEEISREAVSQNLTANVLLEVNVSGEPAKTGLETQQVEPLFPASAELPRLKVLGLMTMASLEGSPDRTRREFAALRELRDRLAPHCPPNIVLSELSMGMSGDYEIAIEEGATTVRIGSALFEGIA